MFFFKEDYSDIRKLDCYKNQTYFQEFEWGDVDNIEFSDVLMPTYLDTKLQLEIIGFYIDGIKMDNDDYFSKLEKKLLTVYLKNLALTKNVRLDILRKKQGRKIYSLVSYIINKRK